MEKIPPPPTSVKSENYESIILKNTSCKQDRGAYTEKGYAICVAL
jgi:hypothetical protein